MPRGEIRPKAQRFPRFFGGSQKFLGSPRLSPNWGMGSTRVPNPRSGPGLRWCKISRRSDDAFPRYGTRRSISHWYVPSPQIRENILSPNIRRVKISKFDCTLLRQFAADLCQIFSVCSRAAGLSTEPNRSRISGQGPEIIEAKMRRNRQKRQILPIFDPPYLRQI